jgi:isopentenyl diphosphate isomerase/L-lactate dehydrogenase-like FMN-dependent dehydrogenase
MALRITEEGVLDTAPARVLLFLELQKCCPEIFNKMEVYADGGVMRGADILKLSVLGRRVLDMGGVSYLHRIIDTRGGEIC